MRLYLFITDDYTEIVATEGNRVKMKESAPTGIFEGIDLYGEDPETGERLEPEALAEQLRARMLELQADPGVNDFDELFWDEDQPSWKQFKERAEEYDWELILIAQWDEDACALYEIESVEKEVDELFLDSLSLFDEDEPENDLEEELEDIEQDLMLKEIIDGIEVDPPLWVDPDPELLPVAKIYAAIDMTIDSTQDYDECNDRWQEYWESKYDEGDCEAEQSYIRIKELIKNFRIAAGDIKTECNTDDLEGWKEILLSIDPEDLEDDGSETGDFEQNKIFSEAYTKVSDIIARIVYLKEVNGHRIDEIWEEYFGDMPHMLFMGGIIGIDIEDSIPHCLKYIEALIENN